MNTCAKGGRIEREFDKWLKSLGHITNRAIRSRFNRNDIWGCFDIMAKHPDYPDKTLYFQISTQWKYGEARKEIEAFPRGIYDMVFMVKKPDRKPFEIMHLTDDGWIKQEGI